MTGPELLEHVRESSDARAASLPPDGDWNPMLFVQGERGLAVGMFGGKLLRVEDVFANSLLPSFIKSVAKKPEAVVFRSSSWMVMSNDLAPGERVLDVRPSLHPNRIEALVLNLVTPTEEDGVGPPVLEWQESSVNWEGRMIAGLRRGVWG